MMWSEKYRPGGYRFVGSQHVNVGLTATSQRISCEAPGDGVDTPEQLVGHQSQTPKKDVAARPHSKAASEPSADKARARSDGEKAQSADKARATAKDINARSDDLKRSLKDEQELEREDRAQKTDRLRKLRLAKEAADREENLSSNGRDEAQHAIKE